MTGRNREALTSSVLGRRTIQTDFNGGAITSDAGVPPLRQVDQRIGLIDAIANAMGYEDGDDRRKPLGLPQQSIPPRRLAVGNRMVKECPISYT